MILKKRLNLGDMEMLEVELVEAKQKVKDIKKLKRMMKKQKHMQERLYKPPVHIVFTDMVDSVCLTFENIVNG